MNAPTARAAWLILERVFTSRSRARVIQIRSRLISAKKKCIHAANFFHNMKTLANTLATINQPLHEKEVISYVSSLGSGPTMTSLNAKEDLTLDEVYSHLLAYEHR
jgi:hypothetical protein